MSEAVYQEVERAIKEHLYICGRYKTPLGGNSFEYPIAIEHGDIVLRDGDCGLAKPTRTITTETWADVVENGGGLWKKVGMWDFVRADNPAADTIAYCHRCPESAGDELYRLRAELDAERAKVERLIGVAESLRRIGAEHYHDGDPWLCSAYEHAASLVDGAYPPPCRAALDGGEGKP